MESTNKQTKKSEYLLTSKRVRSFVHRLMWKRVRGKRKEDRK